jgi:hypothetical protein
MNALTRADSPDRVLHARALPDVVLTSDRSHRMPCARRLRLAARARLRVAVELRQVKSLERVPISVHDADPTDRLQAQMPVS